MLVKKCFENENVPKKLLKNINSWLTIIGKCIFECSKEIINRNPIYLSIIFIHEIQ